MLARTMQVPLSGSRISFATCIAFSGSLCRTVLPSMITSRIDVVYCPPFTWNPPFESAVFRRKMTAAVAVSFDQSWQTPPFSFLQLPLGFMFTPWMLNLAPL